MPRVFTSNVVARNPEDGQVKVFKIGEEVPADLFVGDHAASYEGVTSETSDSNVTPASDDTTVVNEDAAGASEDDDVPYTEWSKADLRAEVDGRELDVPKRATVDELVAALEEDDRSVEEQE